MKLKTPVQAVDWQALFWLSSLTVVSLGFFGDDVAKSQEMTTCVFAGRSSVLTIGFPVTLEALSMPTRGAERRYSSITLRLIQSNDKRFILE